MHMRLLEVAPHFTLALFIILFLFFQGMVKLLRQSLIYFRLAFKCFFLFFSVGEGQDNSSLSSWDDFCFITEVIPS